VAQSVEHQLDATRYPQFVENPEEILLDQPCFRSCRVFGKKTVVTVQGLDWRRRTWGRIASAILRLGERASIELPDATTAVSRTLQEYYRANYGIEPIYVPNGTTLRQRRASGRLYEWGLEPDSYVLFLGRFSVEKNCDLLMQAFERIDTPIKLVLAGGSSHSDAYVKRLRRRQSDRVLVLDWVSGKALDELLTNAMLFVLPSDLEGLSRWRCWTPWGQGSACWPATFRRIVNS
jgi:glycosyltransferase involved in cell wall biosynthesis